MRESWHVLEPTAEFKDNWHLDAIAEHLEAVNKKQINLLQINIPPGTMKSLTASVLFGAWEWGPAKMPGLRYLTASYREDYALRDSRKMRDLVMSEWYQMLYPEVVLMRKGDSDFENTMRGSRKAVPFKSLTGGRGNRVIIDDPHSLDTAESEQERPNTVRTFRESVPSRINDPINDAIIVMMQRMHPEDVCGIIEELGLPYVKLILPMEYVKSISVKTPWFTDPRTYEGELLHPDRFPREKIELKKTELGPHAWDTQFQQLPRARAGSYYFSIEQFLIETAVDGVKQYNPLPLPVTCDAIFAIVDTASKVGKQRDGTGVTYYAYTKVPTPSLLVIDWDIIQIEGNLLTVWLPGVLSRCEELAKQCGARAGSLGVWIEDKDSGTVLLQHAASSGWQAQAIPSEFTAAGKDGRALSVSGYINQGFVKIATPAFEKTSIYKGRTRNHFIHQATTYRMGVGTPNDEDELFDTLCYGTGLVFGNEEGF